MFRTFSHDFMHKEVPMETITGKITWLIVTALSIFFLLKFVFPALGLVLDLATRIFGYVGRTLPR